MLSDKLILPKRTMMILMVCNLDLKINNGASKHALDLFESFNIRGFHLQLFARDFPDKIKSSKIENIVKVKSFYPKKLGYIGTFIMIISFEINLFFKLILLKLKNKTVKGIYLRESELNSAVVLHNLLFKCPFVIESNSIILEDYKENRRRGLILVQSVIERINFNQAEHIITVTNNMRLYFLKKYKISPNKISVIPNGYHFGRNHKIYKTPLIPAQKFKILYLGNLHRREGVQYLIEATSLIRSKKIEVEIIGEGPYLNELIKLVKKLNVEDIITFHPAVQREEVGKSINSAHICVAPLIRYRNNLTGVSPVKVFEYLAHKKVVITSDVAGLEFISSEKAGIQFQADCVDDFAAKLSWAMENYPIAQKFAKNGYEYVKKNHNWAVLFGKIINICEKSLNAKKEISAQV